MQKQKTSFFKSKKTTWTFAIISFLAGFLFLKNNPTGNVVLSNYYPINLISVVGMLLIFCSLILALYSIRK